MVLTHVLSGMGGVGKTQLAARFARQLAESGELDALIWVTASSRQAIIAAYAEAARALHIVGMDSDVESAAERTLRWLEGTNQRWLVVLDNLDAPVDAQGWWPPASVYGRTVVTTRRRDAVLRAEGRTLVEVDLYTPEEAVDYFVRAIGSTVQRREAALLAVDLGHLPLAVAQAAAFIRDRAIDCNAYRQRLNDSKQRLADLVPPEDALPDDHQRTVAATWALSVAAADNAKPRGLARPALTLASLLDPNAIPDEIFTTGPARYFLSAAAGTGTDTTSIDASKVEDALHNLHRLNLITRDASTGVVRVHALVQRATRDELTREQLTAAARAAADALVAMWPPVERDVILSQILRSNSAALYLHARDVLFTPEPHEVLFRSARSFGDMGLVIPAAQALEQLHDDCLRVLGPDHPDTRAARAHVAYRRGHAGDAAGAAQAFQQLLDDNVRLLGPDHPDTLITRAHLAYLRGVAGDRKGAAHSFQQLFYDNLRVFGPDDRNTLTTRAHLAHLRGQDGDLHGAARAFQQLLYDNLRVLGPDHPDTLTTRRNVARWRGEAGDRAGAAEVLAQLLNDNLRVLGPDHPDTLTTRADLAHLRGEAGDTTGALGELKRLLNDRVRVLGPDHPHTIITRRDLARWHGEAGDPARAAEELRLILDDHLRVFGTGHPETHTTRSLLFHWRSQAGESSAGQNSK